MNHLRRWLFIIFQKMFQDFHFGFYCLTRLLSSCLLIVTRILDKHFGDENSQLWKLNNQGIVTGPANKWQPWVDFLLFAELNWKFLLLLFISEQSLFEGIILVKCLYCGNEDSRIWIIILFIYRYKINFHFLYFWYPPRLQALFMVCFPSLCEPL